MASQVWPEPDPDVDRITGAIIGAAIDVHRALGPGYLEFVYQNAMAIALRRRGLRFEPKKRFTVVYEGVVVGEGELDFLVEGIVVVELKAATGLARAHEGQIHHYLVACKRQIGLLLNFHEAVMTDGIKRVNHTIQPSALSASSAEGKSGPMGS
jgi:GxxExxY protein